MYPGDPQLPEPPEPPDWLPPPRALACHRFASPTMLACPPPLLASLPLLTVPLLNAPPRLASPPLRLRHHRFVLSRHCLRSPELPPRSPVADLPPSLPDELLRSVKLTFSTDMFPFVWSVSTLSLSSAEILPLFGQDWSCWLVAHPPLPPVPPDPPPDPQEAPLFSAQLSRSESTKAQPLPLPLPNGLARSSALPDLISWLKTLPLRSHSERTCPPFINCWPPLCLPRWTYLGLKPQASLFQIVILSGFVIFPSWNLPLLLPQFEAFERLSTGLLTQFESALERLSTILLLVTCLVVCVRQPLPFCEDLLPLHEDTLPLYEDSLPLYEVHLLQYEDPLPQYEVVTQNLCSVFVQSFALLVLLPHDAGLHFRNMGDIFTFANLRLSVSDSVCRMWMFLLSQTISRLRISSKFLGSPRRCLVISVAKPHAASLALVAEACSGNASLYVLSFAQDFISSSTVDGFISCCLNGLYVFIVYVYASRFASVAAVDYASLAFVFCFSNFCSVFGE